MTLGVPTSLPTSRFDPTQTSLADFDLYELAILRLSDEAFEKFETGVYFERLERGEATGNAELDAFLRETGALRG